MFQYFTKHRIRSGVGVLLSQMISSKSMHSKTRNEFSVKLGSVSIQGKREISNDTYDVAIIGGGSAGLGFALAGSKLGLKMVVFDYVAPSPKGTQWGLGGTCVNVGCIPKKLMHQSSLLGEGALSAKSFGWHFDFNLDANDRSLINKKFRWETLRQNVQNYIKGLNFGYKKTLKEDKIVYKNAMAVFKDNNTLYYSDDVNALKKAIEEGDESEVEQIKFKYCVVCTGGRPTIFEPVKDVAITSDDVFSLKNPPGKTLVIGGGYIALETAGFLSGLGYSVTLMTRSIYLREFDQAIADMIVNHIQQNMHVQIVPYSLPYKAELNSENKIEVKWRNTQDKSQEGSDTFDTVLMAIGRTANTKNLNLEKVGVKLNPKNNKIIGGVNQEIEKTHAQNVFALGDVLDGVPELTPIAQKSGQLLAQRIAYLLGKNKYSKEEYENTKLDYLDFPTTVFTPLEYSCVGLSEQQAIQKLGDDNIEVYHSKFTPLEEQLSERVDEDFNLIQNKVYCKVICDKRDDLRVIGIHYLGPNAGEVMQGFAVAIKLGLKFKDLQRTVGIHPTCAEEFVLLKTTKKSGEDFEKKGC